MDADRSPVCRQPEIRLSRRRELLLCAGSDVGRRSEMYVARLGRSLFTRRPKLTWRGTPSVHLERQGLLSEEVVRFYISEIALAIDYLHSKKIVHR